MTKFRCGVIGVGMGKGHCKSFHKHPDCELVAVADIDKARLEANTEDLGSPTLYTDGAEMVARENLDIVFVATPNKFHKPLTLAALEAGCHVLCEKPMAMHAEEAAAMLAAAAAADRRLMINFSYRFNPQSQLIKREVDCGALGDIYHAETVWLRRRGLPRFGGWFGQ